MADCERGRRLRAVQCRHARAVGASQDRVHVGRHQVGEGERARLDQAEHRHGGEGLGAAAEEKPVVRASRPARLARDGYVACRQAQGGAGTGPAEAEGQARVVRSDQAELRLQGRLQVAETSREADQQSRCRRRRQHANTAPANRKSEPADK